jgi:hypothetical protein
MIVDVRSSTLKRIDFMEEPERPLQRLTGEEEANERAEEIGIERDAHLAEFGRANAQQLEFAGVPLGELCS